MRRQLNPVVTALGLAAFAVAGAGCLQDVSAYQGDDLFPRQVNNLLPEAPSPFSEEFAAQPWHLGAGAVTGVGPEQPIGFPHYTHVTTLNMQCEYCHANARRTIHGGVPETKVCAGCHWTVKKDSPDIKKLMSFGEGCNFMHADADSFRAPTGMPSPKCDPIPWKKVHDLPDFVHFSHKRHVQGGVNCTECHGQVGLQGKPETYTVIEHDDEGHSKEKEVTGVKTPMVRESTLQMGWCLDCHASHPSIDKNYGAEANLRRAELKDCWTCHK